MKKSIAFLVSLCLFLPSVAIAENIDVSEYVNGEIFVMYKNGLPEVVKTDNEAELRKKIKELSQNDDILLVQPNYVYENQGVENNDALLNLQWGLFNDGSFKMEEQKNQYPVFEDPFGEAFMPGFWMMPGYYGLGYSGYSSPHTRKEAKPGIDINYDDVSWEYHDSGRKLTVALVDTGVDTYHEDLSGRTWVNEGEIPANCVDDDGNGFVDDVNGWNFYHNNNKVYYGAEDCHGTHGAGTIVGISNNNKGISGINQSPNIKLMSVKALGGPNGSGSTLSIVRAIQYAEKNGAKICNLSLKSGADDKALYQTILNSNMLFVIACGNEGSDNDKMPCYPASYELDNIISVANLDYDGNLNSSSNYGANSVDIAAPGSYILSSSAYSEYSYMSGTSMAAPFVTAAAAMIYSNFPDTTLADVKEIMLRTTSVQPSLSGKCATSGMLDIGAALRFDINTLSGVQWAEKVPVEYKGSVPKITVSASNNAYQSFLQVRFSDDDNDIVKACYENGEYDTSYFDGGKKGKSLEVYGSGTATITASEGKYTFYAIDASGNETSLVVTLMMKNRENNNNYSSPKDYYNRNYYQDFDYDGFIREFFSDWGGFFGNFFGY